MSLENICKNKIIELNKYFSKLFEIDIKLKYDISIEDFYKNLKNQFLKIKLSNLEIINILLIELENEVPDKNIINIKKNLNKHIKLLTNLQENILDDKFKDIIINNLIYYYIYKYNKIKSCKSFINTSLDLNNCSNKDIIIFLNIYKILIKNVLSFLIFKYLSHFNKPLLYNKIIYDKLHKFFNDIKNNTLDYIFINNFIIELINNENYLNPINQTTIAGANIINDDLNISNKKLLELHKYLKKKINTLGTIIYQDKLNKIQAYNMINNIRLLPLLNEYNTPILIKNTLHILNLKLTDINNTTNENKDDEITNINNNVKQNIINDSFLDKLQIILNDDIHKNSFGLSNSDFKIICILEYINSLKSNNTSLSENKSVEKSNIFVNINTPVKNFKINDKELNI